MTCVVIAAGGTAGHVVPALAIAAALSAEGGRVEFIGGERAEAELVPAAGYPLHPIAVAGLDRRDPRRALRALGLAAVATRTARGILRRVGADVVLGGGGYVAGPAGLAGRSLGLPLALCEADSHLGLANRALAPFAERVFLAFSLPGREPPKYETTGRPIPAGTGTIDQAEARERLGVPAGRPCVLVFGGSLGARSLNEAALGAFGAGAPFTVLHASGRRDFEELERRLEGLGRPEHYHLHPYLTPFADALAAADLAVARAGGSVFELAAAGLPAVLVPYPHATADHQRTNGLWMERGGGAVVVDDGDLDAARLRAEVTRMLEPERHAAMRRAALALARPDAAARIARATLALARG